jgi:hypothetical protein
LDGDDDFLKKVRFAFRKEIKLENSFAPIEDSLVAKFFETYQSLTIYEDDDEEEENDDDDDE